jgi:hypothetical protein
MRRTEAVPASHNRTAPVAKINPDERSVIMSKVYSNAASAATSALIQRGIATLQFNGLTVNVGFDIHAETPIDQKEELIRMAAVQCVADFFAVYRGVQSEPVTEEGEVA